MKPENARKVIAAGTIGNVLEWYDFAIYGYFAVAIGRHFFPHEDPTAQVLAAFGIFAVGYLMRPVGGAIFGHIGDRYGRRAALTISVAAMAIPTFLIGILPGYAVLGIAAPIALTALRMTQGLSVGGEYTSSMVFLVERAAAGRRGLMGAIACCGAVAGILLGSATGAALAAMMSVETLGAWGWRIPFLMGLVIGLAGYFLRRHVGDSAPTERTRRAPLVETARNHGGLLVRLVGLSVFNAIGFYLIFIYVVSWLQLVDGIAPARALEINTINMALLIPMMLTAGWLSDRFGRKPFLLLATALGFVGALPFFWLMHHPQAELILIGQFGFVVVLGIFLGVQPAIMVEAAPPAIRCTAIALGYNICLGVVGGLTPLTATWLVQRTGDDLSPAFLVMAAAAITFTATFWFRETHRTALDVNTPKVHLPEPEAARAAL